MTKFRFNDDTIILIQHLQTAVPGQVIPYTVLNKLIGRNVQKEAHYVLQSARRALEKLPILEERRVFCAITNVGLQCLADPDITRVGRNYTRRVHKTSAIGIRKLRCIQSYDDMSCEDRTSHNTALSMLGVFFEVTRPKSVKQLESAVAKVQKVLPLTETLRCFQGD